jgi:hypothetical protein
MQCWHKNRYSKQWNKIEDFKINPHTYSKMNFAEVSRTNSWSRKLSSVNGAVKKEYPNVEYLLYTNVDSFTIYKNQLRMH